VIRVGFFIRISDGLLANLAPKLGRAYSQTAVPQQNFSPKRRIDSNTMTIFLGAQLVSDESAPQAAVMDIDLTGVRDERLTETFGAIFLIRNHQPA